MGSMMTSRLSRRGFWRTLPRIRTFWLALASVLPGIALGIHFALQIGASRDAIIFGVAWAVVSAGGLILYLAYRQYAARARPHHNENVEMILVEPAHARQEVLAGIPLAIGASVATYFLLVAELGSAVITVAAGLGCWLLLRRLLVGQRRKFSNGSKNRD